MAEKSGSGLEVLVLGSGGPLINRSRASSGYVVLVDGRPMALVDAGGGVFERLGREGIGAAALDRVLLTHLHIDHSGGLAPVVFSAVMEKREQPVTVMGPAPRGGQPGAKAFVDLLFGNQGAWRYLHSFHGFGIEAHEAPSDPHDTRISELPGGKAIRVRSVAVPHGMMPSVAFRLDTDAGSVTFSGDISGHYPAFVELAKGCDLLVCDFALPERKIEHGELHAKPSVVGRMAAEAGCGTLLLSHVMPPLEGEIEDAVKVVRKAHSGPLVIASDGIRVRAR